MDLYRAMCRIHGKEAVHRWTVKEALEYANELFDRIGEYRTG